MFWRIWSTDLSHSKSLSHTSTPATCLFATISFWVCSKVTFSASAPDEIAWFLSSLRLPCAAVFLIPLQCEGRRYSLGVILWGIWIVWVTRCRIDTGPFVCGSSLETIIFLEIPSHRLSSAQNGSLRFLQNICKCRLFIQSLRRMSTMLGDRLRLVAETVCSRRYWGALNALPSSSLPRTVFIKSKVIMQWMKVYSLQVPWLLAVHRTRLQISTASAENTSFSLCHL